MFLVRLLPLGPQQTLRNQGGGTKILGPVYMEWGTAVQWGWFLLFSRSGGHKTKETYPTRPGSPTPCKQGLRQLIVFHWHLKSRGFGVSSTHWTGLCILKPETVSPRCRDIIVSMFWQMMHACFDFLGQNWEGEGWEARPPIPALPQAKALSSHHASFLEHSSKSQSFTPSRL